MTQFYGGEDNAYSYGVVKGNDILLWRLRKMISFDWPVAVTMSFALKSWSWL